MSKYCLKHRGKRDTGRRADSGPQCLPGGYQSCSQQKSGDAREQPSGHVRARMSSVKKTLSRGANEEGDGLSEDHYAQGGASPNKLRTEDEHELLAKDEKYENRYA
jgi:hypothetical protein